MTATMNNHNTNDMPYMCSYMNRNVCDYILLDSKHQKKSVEFMNLDGTTTTNTSTEDGGRSGVRYEREKPSLYSERYRFYENAIAHFQIESGISSDHHSMYMGLRNMLFDSHKYDVCEVVVEDCDEEARDRVMSSIVVHPTKSAFDDLRSGINECKAAKREFDRHAANSNCRWNFEYQRIFNRVLGSPKEEKRRATDLANIRKAFIAHYRAVAHAIILNRIYKKTMPSLLGRNRRGYMRLTRNKMIFGNVFYQFLYDVNELLESAVYGEAEKRALLELKGLNALVDTDIRVVSGPLGGLYRFRGFCVLAMAIAPMTDLIYGSNNDAGIIYMAEEQTAMRSVIQHLSQRFHLKTHRVRERHTKFVREVCHSVFTQFLQGCDDRVYVNNIGVDAPSTPQVKGRNCDTRRFRFELLRSAREAGVPPASPDAFTKFGEKVDAHDVEVMFQYMQEQVIPKVARELDAMGTNVVKKGVDLSPIFHKHGVNMRYLPSVAKHSKVKRVRRYLCEEMYVRTLKLQIRAKWRCDVEVSDRCLLKELRSFLLMLIDGSSGSQTEIWSLLQSNYVTNKYFDVPEDMEAIDEDLSAVAAGGIGNWSLVPRILRCLGVEYDTRLKLTKSNHMNAHFKSWRMVPLVVTVRAPKFLELTEREKMLTEEVSQQNSILVLVPLCQLIELYRVWSSEQPKVAKRNGLKIVQRILSIVRENDRCVDFGYVMRQLAEFYECFTMSDQQIEMALEGIEIFREFIPKLFECRELLTRSQNGLVRCLDLLGLAYFDKREYDKSIKAFEEAVTLAKDYRHKEADIARIVSSLVLALKAKRASATRLIGPKRPEGTM